MVFLQEVSVMKRALFLILCGMLLTLSSVCLAASLTDSQDLFGLLAQTDFTNASGDSVWFTEQGEISAILRTEDPEDASSAYPAGTVTLSCVHGIISHVRKSSENTFSLSVTATSCESAPMLTASGVRYLTLPLTAWQENPALLVTFSDTVLTLDAPSLSRTWTAPYPDITAAERTHISLGDPSERTVVSIEGTLPDLVSGQKSQTYSPPLSHMLLALTASAYQENTIRASFRDMGMENSIFCHYYDDPMDPRYPEDTVAFAAGTRRLPDGRNLILIVLRGSYGGLEHDPLPSDWRSNFHLGEAEVRYGLHEGFFRAAMHVFQEVNRTFPFYLSRNVYVITGHSRGAAVANLLGKLYLDCGVLARNVFDYTFATPDVANAPFFAWNWKGVSSEGIYGSIFNICNFNDMIAQIPGILGDTLGNASDTLLSAFHMKIQGSALPFPFLWKSPFSGNWGKFGKTYWFWGNPQAGIDLTFQAHHPRVYLDYLSAMPDVSGFTEHYLSHVAELLQRTLP